LFISQAFEFTLNSSSGDDRIEIIKLYIGSIKKKNDIVYNKLNNGCLSNIYIGLRRGAKVLAKLILDELDALIIG
jgi:hypothetical protein